MRFAQKIALALRVDNYHMLDQKTSQQLAEICYHAPLPITESMVLERLQDRYRWPYDYSRDRRSPSVERIADSTGALLRDFYLEDGYIDSSRITDLYLQGSTLVITGVQTLFPCLSNLTAVLADAVGLSEVTAVFYMACRSHSQSYPYHSHDHDVLVRNLQGSSQWLIDGTEYQLKDQSVFFIGAGKQHCCTRVEDLKLTVTFDFYC